MKRIVVLATLLSAASVSLSACAAGNLTVEQPTRAATRVSAVTLAYDESAIDVPDEASAYVRERMERAFFDNERPFARGGQMTVRYRFVGYDEGDRSRRYLAGWTGSGAGRATMVIEAEFFDAAGTAIGRVRGHGQVGGGAFGGSHNSAIDQAVNEIRDYAVSHFRA